MNAVTDTLRAAAALAASGQTRDAIDAYRRGLAADPRHPQAWFELSRLLSGVAQYELALEASARALTYGHTTPQAVHVDRANILTTALNRHDQARAELDAALRVDPDYAPALLNLGNLHEEHGQRDAAAACYRRLLSGADRAPEDALEAEARMLHLDPPLSVADPRLVRLAERAAAALDGAARANLWFALGRAHDALGDADGAMGHWHAANACARRIAPPYAHADTQARVDAIQQAFADDRHPPVSRSSTTAMPLLICGLFRSGSTLLERVLAAHPAIAAGGELELLPLYAHTALAPFPARLASIDAAQLAALADHYRNQIARRVPGANSATWVTDKRPDNFWYIGLARRLFADLKVVLTIRDPLDTGLSIYAQHLDGRVAGYANDLGDIGAFIVQYRRMIAHWQHVYPGLIHDFDYDRFVRAPRATLEPLLAWLGLPWDDACLEFQRQPAVVKTASYWQVRRPLHADSSGRWRRYRAHLAPLIAALGDAANPVAD